MTKKYTAKQGQYLAFFYYYAKVNGQPPAETDIARYFGVTPESAHEMIVTLEKRGFITKPLGRPPVDPRPPCEGGAAGPGVRLRAACTVMALAARQAMCGLRTCSRIDQGRTAGRARSRRWR